MAQRPWNPILEHIRSLTARSDSAACDAELLRQFVSHRDESAFEALLRRHGPMVLRVARRSAGNDADAEDVFQATFLLFARRAAAIRKRESVASWLHGVAHRLALSARSKRIRRQQHERKAAAMRAIESPPESAWSELEETLHEVLAQLPAKYRTPLVYCYLEGRTQEEVARQLGKPLGTVRSWLARGREMLRKRLLRRGISLTVEGASAALLASACATAEAVPPALRMATLQAVHLFATGGNVMTLLSPAAAALVKKGMTAMLISKLKSATACVLVLALLLAGSGWAAHRAFRAKAPEANEAAPKQAAAEDRPRTDVFGDPLPPGAVARLGTVRFRHENWLYEFRLSPDGRTVAATAAGRGVAVWDIATGRPLRHFSFARPLFHLASAPKGKLVAIGGSSGDVRLFDLASGKQWRRFVGSHPGGADKESISGAVFTPDERTLLTWDSIGIVRFWDVQSGKALRWLDGEKWSVWGLSPDGKMLAVTKEKTSGTIRILNVATGKEARQLPCSADVNHLAFSPDSKRLAVSNGPTGQAGRITLWDLGNGKELSTFAGHTDAVFALAFSPDGKLLASGGGDKTIRLWDAKTAKEIRAFQRLYNSVLRLAFTPDGKTLISSGAENHLRLWDVATGQPRLQSEGPESAVADLAYSPDGKRIASASDRRIWIWETATGKLVRRLEGQGETVGAVTFAPDGKSLVSGIRGGTFRIWDVQSGNERRRISNGKDGFPLVALSPDGSTLAAWGHETAQQIHLWHTGTGEKPRSLKVTARFLGTNASLNSLCFSADGKTLYAGDNSFLSIPRWDVTTGKALPFLGEHETSVRAIAVCPDGRSVAAATANRTLYLWETATGQKRLVSNDAGMAEAIAFSPDGRLLAVVNAGNYLISEGNEAISPDLKTREQLRLVRVADGKVIHRFTGHLGGINAVSFSPDGRTLASGGQDTTVLLWDVTKLREDVVKESPPLTPEKLAALWKGLNGKAAEAYGCMNLLIAAPGRSVPFVGEKLKPIAAVDAERFTRLLQKLESDQFTEREEAMQELKKMVAAIEPALRKALRDKLPPETRRRLQTLLDDLMAERLRSLRAIEVIERIGDKPARDLLRRLSEGASGAWRTQEARRSLRRLQPREK